MTAELVAFRQFTEPGGHLRGGRRPGCHGEPGVKFISPAAGFLNPARKENMPVAGPAIAPGALTAPFRACPARDVRDRPVTYLGLDPLLRPCYVPRVSLFLVTGPPTVTSVVPALPGRPNER